MPPEKFRDFFEDALGGLAEELGLPCAAFSISWGGEKPREPWTQVLRGPGGEIRCALALRDRTGAAVPPGVPGAYAMDEVLLLLRELGLPEEGRPLWPADEGGMPIDDPRRLAGYLYERTCRDVARAYEEIAGFDFPDMSSLAEQAYESEGARGEMAFLTASELEDGTLEDGRFFVRFRPGGGPVWSRETLRQIRKLLAGAGENVLCFLRKDPESPYVCQGYLDRRRAWPFPLSVSVRRGGRWTLLAGGRPLFRAASHRIMAPGDPVEAALDRLEREFGGDREAWRPALEAFRRQRHGTALVLLDLRQERPREWMERLVRMNRAFPVMGPHILKGSGADWDSLTELARIDGAYVADTDSGELRYMAAIFDGLALCPGNRAGGARRNALTAWVENVVDGSLPADDPRQTRAAAVIFSEDGGMRTVLGREALERLKKSTNL